MEQVSVEEAKVALACLVLVVQEVTLAAEQEVCRSVEAPEADCRGAHLALVQVLVATEVTPEATAVHMAMAVV